MKNRVAITCAVLMAAGCSERWARTPGPDLNGTNALSSVTNFIAAHGWNMYTNQDTTFWEDLDPKAYISDLPWKRWASKRFQARTEDGILYVLLGDEFHHDYFGVAYNPNTNRFPTPVRGFKPIGGHWYAWTQPEFWYTAATEGEYE